MNGGGKWRGGMGWDGMGWDGEVDDTLPYEICRPPSYSSEDRTRNSLMPYSSNPNPQSRVTNQIVINNARAAVELLNTGVDIVREGHITRYRATRACSNGCGRYCDPRFAFTGTPCHSQLISLLTLYARLRKPQEDNIKESGRGTW